MTDLKKEILTVLRAKYKKDCPEAFKAVEEAGYEVYKYDGTWGVRDRNTWKHVRLDCRGGRVWTHNRPANPEKMDIIAYLSTPINNKKHEMEYAPSKMRISDLSYAKWKVQESEKEIEELARKLERARKYYIECTKNLLKLKAEMGLLK